MRPEKTSLHATHLFALSSLAVAQPLFDLLSRGAEFFVAHRSTPVELIAVSLILCLGPAASLLLAQRIAAWARPGLLQPARLLSIALLVFLLSLGALKSFDDGAHPLPTLAGAALAAALFTWAYGRQPGPRLLLTILAPLALVFPLLFLFGSPVSELLQPSANTPSPLEPQAKREGTPTIFLILDELSVTSLMDAERNIDAIRYPHFADLAAHSTWYRNATTVAIETVAAVPAILSGRYPDHPGHIAPVPRLPTAEAYPESLFSLLSDSHQLRVFESLTQLCPASLCADESSGEDTPFLSMITDLGVVYLHWILPEAMSRDLPRVTATWKGFGADAFFASGSPSQETLFEGFLATLEVDAEGSLYFLHTLLPHVPWEYLPDGHRYGPTDAPKFPHGLGEVGWETWDEDPWHSVQGFQRYLLQLGFVDRLLGRLLERLREAGLWERSLVVVVADHGLSFRPGDKRRPITESNAHDILPVPLFIKQPWQTEGTVDERSVETIDILPTLADILGIPIPWEIDGRSLLERGHSFRAEKVVYRAQGEVKLIFPDPAREKYKSLRRMLELFGSGDEPPGLYGIGPHPELLGQAVQGWTSNPAGGCEIRLEEPRVTEAWDPDAPLLPLHVVATLSTHQEKRPIELALAVDGVVRALTRTYESGRWTRFSALLPESAMAGPSPEVTFYLIAAGDPGLELTLCGESQPQTYGLQVDRRGQESLIDGRGETFPIVPGYFTAHLDSMRIEGNRFELAGWAADVGHHEIPEAIAIFADGRLLHAAPTNEPREEIAGIEEPSFLWRGFRYNLSHSSLGPNPPREMRLFAVSRRGVASEVSYFPEFPWAPDPS